MGCLFCFLIKLPSSAGCAKLRPGCAQIFDVLAESLPMISKGVLRLKQLLPCSLTPRKDFTYLAIPTTTWLTVTTIASIYPIVPKYSPENFGKTHIQYSDNRLGSNGDRWMGRQRKVIYHRSVLGSFSSFVWICQSHLIFFLLSTSSNTMLPLRDNIVGPELKYCLQMTFLWRLWIICL